MYRGSFVLISTILLLGANDTIYIQALHDFLNLTTLSPPLPHFHGCAIPFYHCFEKSCKCRRSGDIFIEASHSTSSI